MSAPPPPTAGELVALADDVFVWCQSPAGYDAPNAGVIVGEDGITLVDTLVVPSQAAALEAALAQFGLPVRRVVYSSSHIECVGGSAVYWMAARYGRSQTSALLDQPANVDVLQRLHPAHAQELALLAEQPTRPVSHTVDVGAYLTTSHLVVPTNGHMQENLVVLVPEAEVLFAGSMCTFGVTPNAFDGDPQAWADSLVELCDLAAVVVPGIGPVGGIDEVNVERAALLAAGDPSVPSSMLRLAGLA